MEGLIDREKGPGRDFSPLSSRNPVHGSLIRLGEWSMTRPVSLTCLEFNRPGLLEDSMTESQDMGTGEVSSGDSSIHDYATHDEKYKNCRQTTLYIPSQGRRHISLPFTSLAKLRPLLNHTPRSFIPRSLRGEEGTSDEVTLHHSARTLLFSNACC